MGTHRLRDLAGAAPGTAQPSLRAILAPALVAAAIVAAVLLPGFPEHLYRWDEFQLAYGVERFDLTRHQPHPPGYVLFVLLGRAVAALSGGDAIRALRLLSVGATALFAGAVAAALPRSVAGAGRWLFALAAAACAATSPVLAFYGVAALPYAVEGACWTALLLAVSRHPTGARRAALAFGVALAGGLRPTLTLWGVAIWAFEALRRRGWTRPRDLPALAGCFALGIAAWAAPLVALAGGWRAYVAATRGLTVGNIWNRSVFVTGPGPELADRLRRLTLDAWTGGGLLLVAAGALVALRLARRGPAARAVDDPLAVGGAIAFLFYLSTIYDTTGYAVAVVMPVAAYALLGVARAAGSPRRAVAWGALALAGAAATPWLPSRPTALGPLRHEYRRHDAEVAARVAAVRSRFDPSDTVLVTSIELWTWGLRHVGHELPEFTAVQLAHDPFFAIASAERPYLLSRERELRAVGPDGLDLQTLLPDPTRRLEHVVYLSPTGVRRFVDRTCWPFAHLLPVSGEEDGLPVFVVGGHARVRITGQTLVCEPVATTPSANRPGER